jgi:hypothetical protein
MGAKQSTIETSPSKPATSSSENDCTGLRKIDDTFYTDLANGDGTSSTGKLAIDATGGCLIKTHIIELPSRKDVSLRCEALRYASIRKFELVFPKSNGSEDWRKSFRGIHITIGVGGESLLQLGVEDLDLMCQIQPGLVTEDAENKYISILEPLEWQQFMYEYQDIMMYAIYEEPIASLSMRIEYCDFGRERAHELLKKHSGIVLTTPFLTPLTKYSQNDSRLVSKAGNDQQFEARIQVYPRTTSIFIYDKHDYLKLRGAEAIYCGIKLPIQIHTDRICSITFDAGLVQKPFTPKIHYEHVANSSKMLRYLTIRSPLPISIDAELRFTQLNMLTTVNNLTCVRYTSPSQNI